MLGGAKTKKPTKAARRASNLEGAPGRPNCARGANQFGWDDNTTDVGALDRNRVMPPHSIRFDHIVFKRYAFGVIFLEPSARSFFVHKNFEMAGIANTVSGVDIDPNGRHWSLLSLRRPQCVSLRSGLNTRSTFRFNACMTPMRANIAGPSCSATNNSACIASCHSSTSCSALGDSVMYSATSLSVTKGFRPGTTIGSKNR
jgi:hypothetical protein